KAPCPRPEPRPKAAPGAPLAPAEPRERVPGPPPQSEDRCGGRDPQPGDAQGPEAGGEQDGERRPQVVEDRAADEEPLGRSGCREAPERGSLGGNGDGMLHDDMVTAPGPMCHTQTKPFLLQRLRSKGVQR